MRYRSSPGPTLVAADHALTFLFNMMGTVAPNQ